MKLAVRKKTVKKKGLLALNCKLTFILSLLQNFFFAGFMFNSCDYMFKPENLNSELVKLHLLALSSE